MSGIEPMMLSIDTMMSVVDAMMFSIDALPSCPRALLFIPVSRMSGRERSMFVRDRATQSKASRMSFSDALLSVIVPSMSVQLSRLHGPRTLTDVDGSATLGIVSGMSSAASMLSGKASLLDERLSRLNIVVPLQYGVDALPDVDDSLPESIDTGMKILDARLKSVDAPLKSIDAPTNIIDGLRSRRAQARSGRGPLAPVIARAPCVIGEVSKAGILPCRQGRGLNAPEAPGTPPSTAG